MSATTTAVTYILQSTLQDYEVHISGNDINEANIDASSNPSSATTPVQNPPGWPRDQNRIPNYRPLNRNLNFEERPNGSNGIERAFLFAMFTGVALNAGMAQTWGKTGGKVFTKVFRYAIGGEW
ncbi:hypothetical protein V492_00917 [Pseudogymnoascus sp. VKM F-4246]|nr:hypothetical protein V492_00917 [Pseudogymnoascus sp. VKM F-4246]